MAGLHLRTIEALALAIEAKDHTTHDHLRRVRVYAIEIAKHLGLGKYDIEALRAAALLHDIGKLAVPEHIINKPGRLSREEFEKMKIHPVVGAEILKHVGFPYPVVPIVRSHHEKWDGSGYPDGLKGEEIPIGARILGAVDCLDALASDRQYRRALPLDQAMEHVAQAAGTEFDPSVVDVLKRRYIELERMAQTSAEPLESRLLAKLKVQRGAEPAAGFERSAPSAPVADSESFLTSIAAARQEGQTLFELSHDLGNSLSLDETLSLLSVRLKKLVPCDTIAVYVTLGDRLVPQYVSGDNFRLFSSLEIPMGEGVSGWVAQNCKPIVNGNPSVEPGYLRGDDRQFSTLASALSVPLEGVSGIVGVLTLYKAERDAFTNDHLRVLLAIASKVGMSIENALKYQQAESSATTDYLTGLPNARSLFLHLDRELARCKRTHTQLAVMVCDLDGFKQINDRFGHLEGNKVLRLFADFIKAVCREYDYVARMGGDEFVIVAPGLTPKAAEEKAAHLLSLAREAGRQVCGHDFLSVSIGFAFYPETGGDAEQLLSEADRRMYAIKQAQHQSTVMHGPAPSAAVN
jgi:diguanylate cyclase (GGDEF)-like protein/putative nucleotidyltransferase with HDIG domain